MYFGKINVKSLIILFINTLIILLTGTIINGASDKNQADILRSNGYEKEVIGGFSCYVKEISSVSSNLHELAYIQFIPEKQLEQGNIEDFQVGIKVTCGSKENDKNYVIYDKNVDDRHKHCNLCHRYIGNELVKTFNEKRDVRLQETKTNAGALYTAGLASGLNSTVFLLLMLGTLFYTLIVFLKYNRTLSDNEVSVCNILYKSSSLVSVAVLLWCFCSLVITVT